MHFIGAQSIVIMSCLLLFVRCGKTPKKPGHRRAKRLRRNNVCYGSITGSSAPRTHENPGSDQAATINTGLAFNTPPSERSLAQWQSLPHTTLILSCDVTNPRLDTSGSHDDIALRLFEHFRSRQQTSPSVPDDIYSSAVPAPSTPASDVYIPPAGSIAHDRPYVSRISLQIVYVLR